MPPKRVVRETVSLYEAKTRLSRLVDRTAPDPGFLTRVTRDPVFARYSIDLLQA
jgi:hypothetical protein